MEIKKRGVEIGKGGEKEKGGGGGGGGEEEEGDNTQLTLCSRAVIYCTVELLAPVLYADKITIRNIIFEKCD